MFPVPTYVVPERLRKTLSRPLGDLFTGSEVDVGQLLRRLIFELKPPKIILVGDSVSRKANQAGIVPDLMIIDNMEKRKPATRRK